MCKNIIGIIIIILSFLFLSCNNTGNEPNLDTNTHNTSQPSAAVHSINIKVDARSQIPPNRLNDGVLETRASNRSIFPQGEATETLQEVNRMDEQADVEENLELQNQEQIERQPQSDDQTPIEGQENE